jgi:hypothetical protein
MQKVGEAAASRIDIDPFPRTLLLLLLLLPPSALATLTTLSLFGLKMEDQPPGPGVVAPEHCCTCMASLRLSAWIYRYTP